MEKLGLIIIFAIITIGIFLLIRNEKVYRFRTEILNIVHNKQCEMISRGKHKELKNQEEYLCGKNSYEKMLFSFKKLKLENFYTEEQIKWLLK